MQRIEPNSLSMGSHSENALSYPPTPSAVERAGYPQSFSHRPDAAGFSPSTSSGACWIQSFCFASLLIPTVRYTCRGPSSLRNRCFLHGDSMVFDGDSMEIRWRFHGDSMEFDGASTVGPPASRPPKRLSIRHIFDTFCSFSSEAQK